MSGRDLETGQPTTSAQARPATDTARKKRERGPGPIKPTVAEVFNDQRLGVSVHALVGECLQDGLRHPSPVDLLTRAGRHALTVDSRSVHRQAAKQALLTTAAIYFRWFTPPEDWEFVGAEIAARGCRFDLVWQAAGRVVVDEIKSGAAAAPGRAGFGPQVARLVRGGEAEYMDAFLGVRVLILAAPALSYLARPGGGQGALL